MIRHLAQGEEKMRLISMCWFIFILALSGQAWAETYRISMEPRYSPDEINRRIIPLAESLEQETGHTIEVVILSDFSQYEKRLKNGSIEIGYESPYMYALVSDAHEAVASALKGKGIDKFRGIVNQQAVVGDGLVVVVAPVVAAIGAVVPLVHAGGDG